MEKSIFHLEATLQGQFEFLQVSAGSLAFGQPMGWFRWSIPGHYQQGLIQLDGKDSFQVRLRSSRIRACSGY